MRRDRDAFEIVSNPKAFNANLHESSGSESLRSRLMFLLDILSRSSANVLERMSPDRGHYEHSWVQSGAICTSASAPDAFVHKFDEAI